MAHGSDGVARVHSGPMAARRTRETRRGQRCAHQSMSGSGEEWWRLELIALAKEGERELRSEGEGARSSWGAAHLLHGAEEHWGGVTRMVMVGIKALTPLMDGAR
jgi:hypothetical protein